MTAVHFWGSMIRSMKAVMRTEVIKKPRIGMKKAMAHRPARTNPIRLVAFPSGQNCSRFSLPVLRDHPEMSIKSPHIPMRSPAKKGMNPATGPEDASQI